MKNSVALLFITLFFSVSLFSQKAPFKIGKVSKKELRQDFCPIDSSASAMVLYSYGHFRNRDYTFSEKRRIKILKMEGEAGDLSSWEKFGAFLSKLNEDRQSLPDETADKIRQLIIGAEDDFEKIKWWKR